jgi:hypothetical protein
MLSVFIKPWNPTCKMRRTLSPRGNDRKMQGTTISDPLEALLKRSHAFEGTMLESFPVIEPVLAVSNPKYELVASACTLAVEHANALRAAFQVSAPNSASALLRLQYEALLRSAWLMFVATPEQIEKLANTLDLNTEKTAKNLPGYLDMLNAVVRVAPQGLAAPLAEFNKYSRHALNSYVHAGIHPLHRTRNGFPNEIAVTVIQFSNALMHFAYRLLATLSGSQERMDSVTRAYTAFHDCVPMKKE